MDILLDLRQCSIASNF